MDTRRMPRAQVELRRSTGQPTVDGHLEELVWGHHCRCRGPCGRWQQNWDRRVAGLGEERQESRWLWQAIDDAGEAFPCCLHMNHGHRAHHHH